MKKPLSLLFSIILLLSIVPVGSFAENGPMGPAYYDEEGNGVYYSRVTFVEPDSDGNYPLEPDEEEQRQHHLYSGGAVLTSDIPGASYSLDENALYLNDFDHPELKLEAVYMGDDFKVVLSGRSALAGIEIIGTFYGCGLRLDGNGSLKVNERNAFDNGIIMNAATIPVRLAFSRDVRCTVFGRLGAASVFTTSIDRPEDCIVFENGQVEEISTANYSRTDFARVNAAFIDMSGDERFGGTRLLCADDPEGIYALTEGYREDPEKPLRWVSRFIYYPEFDIYMPDMDFGDFGEIEYTLEEWNAQTTYTEITELSESAEQLGIFDPDDPDATSYRTFSRLSKADDPEGIYGIDYITTDENDNPISYHVVKYLPVEGTDKYLPDESFESFDLPEAELEGSEYAFVYAAEPVQLRWSGSFVFTGCLLYRDEDGKKYAYDQERDLLFSFDDDAERIEYQGIESYILSETSETSVESLIPVFEEIVDEDSFIYTLTETEFRYNGGADESDGWRLYANALSDSGKTFHDGDVVEICAGRSIFLTFETDTEKNNSHGVSNTVGFSDGYPGGTLSSAGFRVTTGFGSELGFDSPAFGLKIDASTLEAGKTGNLNFYVYVDESPLDFITTPHALDCSLTVKVVSHMAASSKVVKPTCTKEGYTLNTCAVCGASYKTETIAKLAHTPVKLAAKAATCTSTGLTEGSKCSVCGTIITAQKTVAKLAHTYKNVVTPASPTADGKIVPTCSVCGAKKAATTIAKASKVTISKAKFVYNGKIQKPTLIVKDSAGKAIAAKYYTVKWSNASSKAVGSYTVTVTFSGNYKGSKKLTYTIVPKAVTGLKNAKAEKTAITLSWTKATGAKYYEVWGSTDGKTFKKIATPSTNTYKVTKVNGKALAAGKTYYFKVRALDSTKKLIGAYSVVLKTGTQTATPTISKLTSTKSKTATVTWGKVTGAKSYTVYTSADGKTFKAVKSGITATSFTITKLTGRKKLYVKVVAVNAYGKASAMSAAKSVTVKK